MRHSGLLVWMRVSQTHSIGPFHFFDTSRGYDGFIFYSNDEMGFDHRIWDPCVYSNKMLLIVTSTHGQIDFDLLHVMVQLDVGYFLECVWMCAVGWVCWSIRDFPIDTWRLSVVDDFLVGSYIVFSWMFDFREGFVDIFYTSLLIVSNKLHSKSEMRGHVEVYMSWLGRVSFSLPRIESRREIVD
jgi:hypothetical protein